MLKNKAGLTARGAAPPIEMSSCNHTFVHQMQNFIEWVDTEAQRLTKEQLLDGVRLRVLVMAKKFIAFPHCQNFSLMAQPVAKE